MLKDLLQGKPLGHPLHPVLVHFPVGLFVLSLVLDLASLAMPQTPGLVRAAFYSMTLGVITALLAAVPGFVDYTEIRRDHKARRIATAHMTLNLIAVALYAVSLGTRTGALDASKTPALPLLLSVAAFGLLSISGYLGGHLVYSDGVGVGRHRRRAPLPHETLRLATTGPNAHDWTRTETDLHVPIPGAERLRDQETLRLSIDGTVVVLLKTEGQYYAFQEFCTHRFGPLSEGVVRDHQVVCPWHRSCFDVGSGKVTKGPAKVELKTWKVHQEDGRVFVIFPLARPTTTAAKPG